jgi:hypothetical protein
LLRKSNIGEIESQLDLFGRGNHTDNMRVLREFSRFYIVELDESEFINLIFLQNEHVLEICPPGKDRKLKAVALRALKVKNPVLHANWDLGHVAARTEEALASPPLRALVLRPTRSSEVKYGDWYIQDGSHTALGYAMALLSGKSKFLTVRAYRALP